MKNSARSRFLFALFVFLAPLWAAQAQTSFFSDNFSNGSTLNSATPTTPTANSASYEVITGKTLDYTNIAPNDLNFGIAGTTGGIGEIEAVFSTNAIPLDADGDYLEMVVVFTNTSGMLEYGNGFLGVGLFNAGNPLSFPIPTGVSGSGTADDEEGAVYAAGGVQDWVGYQAEVGWTSEKSQVITRPSQSAGSTGQDQDLVTSGSGSESYDSPGGTAIGDNVSLTNALSAGQVYTWVLTIAYDGAGSLAVSNELYSGSGPDATNGTPLVSDGGVATGANYLTGGFNGLGFGFYEKYDTGGPSGNQPASNVVDIASINIFGHSSAASGPPSISLQPANVLVTTNGSCAFIVNTLGLDQTYQWHRSGTNLVNAGNISGATSSMLVISPAAPSDQLNDYYVTITGAGDFSTNSADASLSLVQSTNLVWDENVNEDWDVDTSDNWTTTNGIGVLDFSFGDPVSFGDLYGGGDIVLNSPYLSASSVTVNANVDEFEFSGSGSFAGPGALYCVGASPFTIDNVNTYTGGTLISNAQADVILENYGGLGTGPVIFGQSGGEMEITVAGGATTGIEGNVVVADNFQVLFDVASNTYSGVFLGNLSGTAGKTLTLTNGTPDPTGQNRVRIYGGNTIYNGNIFFASSAMLLASYQSSGSQTYNGVISGAGQFMEKGTTTYMDGPNTYSGGTTPAQGVIALGLSSVGSPGSLVSGPIGTGPLFVSPDTASATTGSGMIEASVPNLTIGNALQYQTGTNNLVLQIGGTNNLTFTGPFTLNGNDGNKSTLYTNRWLQVTNSGLTTFSGNITDSGVGYGLGIFGTGVVALSGNDSYTGMTGITNATVLVNGSLSTSVVIVTNAGTLGGSGTISAPVTIQSGGTLAAGNQAIGTLSINNTLTFQTGSTDVVDVSQSSGNSKVSGLTSVTYAGTLAPNVVSGTLSAGQNFTIFSAAAHSGNFSAIAGTPGAGLGWEFDPTNGVLSVVTSGPIVPTIPPRVTGFSLSGGTVTITATNGVNGGTYYLLGTTNVATPIDQWVPLATNVVTASGGTETFTFAGTNAYTVGSPMWFFMLSSTNN